MPTRWIGPLPKEPSSIPGRGRLRVHIGMLPGCGQIQGLVRTYRLAHEQGQRVIVLPSQLGAPEGWVLPQWQPPVHVDATDNGLWNPEVLDALLKEHPHLVIVESLNRFDLTAEQHEAQRQNILELLKVGISVETTLDLIAVALVNDILNPTYHWPLEAKVPMAFLRHNVNDYVVHDLPPTLMMQRFYEGQITLPPPLRSQRSVLINIANLSRLREALFATVGAHVTDQVRATNPELYDASSRETELNWKALTWRMGVILLLGGGLLAFLHYMWMNWYLSLSAVSTVLLGAVVMTALSQSFFIIMMSSLLGFLGLNFLFLSPAGSGPLKLEDALTLIVFISVGTLVGYFTHRNRQSAISDRLNLYQHRNLLRLAHDVSSIESLDDCLRVGVKNLEGALSLSAFIVLEMGDGEKIFPETTLSEVDRTAIQWVINNNAFSRAKAPQKYSYCPLTLSGRVLGVIGLSNPEGTDTADHSYAMINFLRNYSNLLAGALARIQLRTVSSEASTQATRESLRSALLSSISHDLKTPLVSIIGGLSTLEHAGKGLPQKDQSELVKNARMEAERLHSVIHNVLEVTRLESGSLKPNREAVAADELLKEAIKRAKRYYTGLKVEINMPDKAGDIYVDPILTGQVFYNVLDNVAKYAGVKKPVEVDVEPNGSLMTIRITDNGPGLKVGEEEKIFDKFFRSEKQDRGPTGSGLGLAICRGIVEAQGGKISAANRAKGKGAMFTIHLPMATEEQKISNPNLKGE